MTASLSDAQAAAFCDHGYHFPVPVLSPLEAADYRKRLETYEQTYAGGPVSGAPPSRMKPPSPPTPASWSATPGC